MKVGSHQNDFIFCSNKTVVPHMWVDRITYMERSTHICGTTKLKWTNGNAL